MSVPTIRRKLVTLGIVGTGPLGELPFKDAFRRLSQRAIIRKIYDVVSARAELESREWQALVAPSLTSLLDQKEIDAVVILDTAWQGLVPLKFACEQAKATLLFRCDLEELSHQNELAQTVRNAGLTVMMAFPRRHTPATNRLRELMATRFGTPLALHIEAVIPTDQSAAREQLVGLLDWCTYIAGKPPSSVSTSASGIERRIHLKFPTAQQVPTAEIVLQSATSTETTSPNEVFAVSFSQGHAQITGPNLLAWQLGAETHQEDLKSERASIDIILDQFCRRVVGGLVPVPDLSDAVRAAKLAGEIISAGNSTSGSAIG